MSDIDRMGVVNLMLLNIQLLLNEEKTKDNQSNIYSLQTLINSVEDTLKEEGGDRCVPLEYSTNHDRWINQVKLALFLLKPKVQKLHDQYYARLSDLEDE